MNETQATKKADELISLLIQHQAGLLGVVTPLASDEGAKQAAQALATLRATLITQLAPQPSPEMKVNAQLAR